VEALRPRPGRHGKREWGCSIAYFMFVY
jgi:hypothetical protein